MSVINQPSRMLYTVPIGKEKLRIEANPVTSKIWQTGDLNDFPIVMIDDSNVVGSAHASATRISKYLLFMNNGLNDGVNVASAYELSRRFGIKPKETSNHQELYILISRKRLIRGLIIFCAILLTANDYFHPHKRGGKFAKV